MNQSKILQFAAKWLTFTVKKNHKSDYWLSFLTSQDLKIKERKKIRRKHLLSITFDLCLSSSEEFCLILQTSPNTISNLSASSKCPALRIPSALRCFRSQKLNYTYDNSKTLRWPERKYRDFRAVGQGLLAHPILSAAGVAKSYVIWFVVTKFLETLRKLHLLSLNCITHPSATHAGHLAAPEVPRRRYLNWLIFIVNELMSEVVSESGPLMQGL